MIILSIETSCDETAVSLVEATGTFPDTSYRVLGDAVFSQIDIHREYGGIFPAVAKREHAKTLVPMLEKALGAANLSETPADALTDEMRTTIEAKLAREYELKDALLAFYASHGRPQIDLIAVTNGPGLEPTLWVGINFAEALGTLWDIKVVGINHMEGHIFSSLFQRDHIAPIAFPALALLISGGHTEIVLMRDWGTYELVGQTRDDAVGEAFDKVARMLKLPYPGGPEISKLAELRRTEGKDPAIAFPRPMIATSDCDFSFSGLKTAVLYHLKDREISDEERAEVAHAFEDAVAEVLIAKVKRAIGLHDVKTVILGGGVSANTHIRRSFEEFIKNEYADIALYLPAPKLTTDNAVMIALAAYAHKDEVQIPLIADGNLSVSSRTNTAL